MSKDYTILAYLNDQAASQVKACSTAVSQGQHAGLLLSLGAAGSWDDAAVGR